MNRLAVYAGDGVPIFRRDSQFLVSTFFSVIKFEYIFFFKMADIVSNVQDTEEFNFVLVHFIRQNINISTQNYIQYNSIKTLLLRKTQPQQRAKKRLGSFWSVSNSSRKQWDRYTDELRRIRWVSW